MIKKNVKTSIIITIYKTYMKYVNSLVKLNEGM